MGSELFHTASLQRQQIVGDVVRLLRLQEVRNELAGQLAGKSGLQWRLSLAMELVASPALLIIHGAHPSKPWFSTAPLPRAKQALLSAAAYPVMKSSAAP